MEFEKYNNKQARVKEVVGASIGGDTILFVCILSSIRVLNAAGDGFDDNLDQQTAVAKAHEQLGRINKERRVLVNDVRAWNQLLKLKFDGYMAQQLEDEVEVKIQGSWDEITQCHTLKVDGNLMVSIYRDIKQDIEKSKPARQTRVPEQSVHGFPSPEGSVGTSGTASAPKMVGKAPNKKKDAVASESRFEIAIPGDTDGKQKKGRVKRSRPPPEAEFPYPVPNRRNGSCCF